jgi:hypothetical protein
MNESGRTITYVVVAAVAVGLAWILKPPGEITPESLRIAQVGKPFFDDFNPGDATSIRVVGYDEAQATSRVFGVKFENGKWTIPSRHNYPADGADRLAKTAASARGIKREELASSSPQNQEQLGVIDPLDEDKSKLKGRGQRITLNKGDSVLVDLIIGKQLKDRPGFFYIRKPGEDSTYVAKVSLDLSTKFADWVETDLLKIDRNDLTEIVENNYKTEDAGGGRLQIVAGEMSRLTREKSADPWKLDGLDEATEELDLTKVNAMIGALDDLKLVGVRPKPKGFNPDLSIDPEYVKRQSDLQQLAFDLQARGYSLGPDRKNNALKLYADEGELTAATNKGVVYTLKFGSVFLGDETEIEVGAAAEKEKEDADKESPEDGAGDKDKVNAKSSEGKQSSRYLFVTVDFDEKQIGNPPEKPTPPEEVASAAQPEAKPTKVAAKHPSPSDESQDQDADAQSDGNADTSDTNENNCLPAAAADEEPAAPDDETSAKVNEGTTETDEPKSEANKDKAPGGDDRPQNPPQEEKKKSPEDVKKEYDERVKKYESELKTHDDKVTAGKKLVKELNARFSGWYYVISAENFNKLHLSRKELVKEKGKSADDKKADMTSGSNNDSDATESLDSDAVESDPGGLDDDQDDKATDVKADG